MITVTVSVISITAVIVGYAGVAAFTGVAKSKVSKCAASIKALIDVAANDDVVTMTFRYKCKEVWESDPSYSDGGFWFLGYVTDSSYFLLLLIKTLMLTANIAKLFIPIEICFADMILVFYEGY